MGRYIDGMDVEGLGSNCLERLDFWKIHTKTDDLEDSEVVVSEYFLRIFCLNRMHAIF